MNQIDQSVNEKKQTIVRVVHNKENPYVMLNKSALWNPNLSLKAAGLWARCLSRPDDWTFSLAELVKRSKEGRRAVDSAMQELIEQNYVCRLEFYKKGEDGKYSGGGVEYIFFEFPATEEEKQAQLDKFKKSFQHCGFSNCRYSNCRNDHLLIHTTTKKEEATDKDITPPIPPLSEKKNASEDAEKRIDFSPSAEVMQTADEMVVALKASNGECKVPKSLSQWHVSIDHMIRLDGRSPKQIIAVFRWALADYFWGANMYRPNPPKYLREKFDQFEMKMNAKPPKKERTFAPCSDDEEAFKTMQKMNETAL